MPLLCPKTHNRFVAAVDYLGHGVLCRRRRLPLFLSSARYCPWAYNAAYFPPFELKRNVVGKVVDMQKLPVAKIPQRRFVWFRPQRAPGYSIHFKL